LSDAHIPQMDDVPQRAPQSNELPQQTAHHNALYYASVFVKNHHNGAIFIDDPALAEWTVDAMSIVRRQLYRAANGLVALPYSQNWAEGDDHSITLVGSLVTEAETTYPEEYEGSVVPAPRKLPLWASLTTPTSALEPLHESIETEPTKLATQRMEISDLPLMAAEVSELLNAMEDIMEMQRERRLEKLKQPYWVRRTWYLSAIGFPSVTYLCYRMVYRGYSWELLKYTAKQTATFFREHVSEPVSAM
jgi:hypothetical protein